MTMDDNSNAAMTPEVFEDLLERRGADLAAWPAASRAAARDLLNNSEDARTLLREAQTLVALLDEAPAGEVHAALAARILQGAPGHAPASQDIGEEKAQGGWLLGVIGILWPEFGWVRPAALMAVSLAAGLYVGITAPAMTAETEQTDLFAYVFDVPDTWDTSAGETGDMQ